MNLIKLANQLKEHEGFRGYPYVCTAGKTTLGYGRNIQDKGITKEEAAYMLHNDMDECIIDLSQRVFPEQFTDFPDGIQRALTNMRFQLGHTGFRKFKKMITAFRRQNLTEAVKQMKDSRWFYQVPNRANDLIQIVEEYL